GVPRGGTRRDTWAGGALRASAAAVGADCHGSRCFTGLRTRSMLALEWLEQAHGAMGRIEAAQLENIRRGRAGMAESIAADRWVQTFGCGHATIPVEEMYPRIGGFVGFHPIVELPLTFFTRIVGEMGVRQFVFLEGVEGYGDRIMEGYDFDPRDTMWIFSHSGINAGNIAVA